MKFGNRALARAGAGVVGLLVAGAFIAPAVAAETQTDLELTVAGTKLAAGAPGKIGLAKIANNGTGTPTALTVTADLSALDLDKVIAVPLAAETDGEECVFDEAARKVTCSVPAERIPGPGGTLEYEVLVFRGVDGAEPYSGQVTFTISSPDDSTPDNNTKTVEVALSEQSGVDLGVWVPDVKDKFASLGDEPGTPLHPGDNTINFGAVFNWGDMVAKGVKVTVQLPEHVTFAEVEQDCEYSDDNRKATCTYADLVLRTTQEDTDEEWVAEFYWPITVGADAAEGVTLGDGSWTVEALSQLPVDAPEVKALAPSALPKNVRMTSAQDLGVNEVDASDNVDGFAVVVAAAEGGTGGGGSLPVTGVQASVIGGVGLAVLAIGGVLFMLARRRRVVLVTPNDEKPTA